VTTPSLTRVVAPDRSCAPALPLDLHLHCFVLDGVYVRASDDTL
jgi:hypothetical protein